MVAMMTAFIQAQHRAFASVTDRKCSIHPIRAGRNVTQAATRLQPFQSASSSFGGRWTDSGQQRPQALLTGKSVIIHAGVVFPLRVRCRPIGRPLPENGSRHM
jgi:hypothetical protein